MVWRFGSFFFFWDGDFVIILFLFPLFCFHGSLYVSLIHWEIYDFIILLYYYYYILFLDVSFDVGLSLSYSLILEVVEIFEDRDMCEGYKVECTCII